MKAFVLAVLIVASLPGCSRSPAPTTPPAAKSEAPPEINASGLDPALARVIAAAQQAARDNPQSAEAWGKLGQALHAAEFYGEAQECYNRAAKLDPASGRWVYLLATLQLQNDPETAIANLARAVAMIPATNDAPRLRLATALVERGRLPEAGRELETLLASNPGHPAARVELARVKLAGNDAAAAENLLQPALTNVFTARAALLLLSQIKQRTGDGAAAAQLAQRAGSMPKPFDWPDAHLREVQGLLADRQTLLDRANSLIMRQKFPEAETVLNQLSAQAPEDPETLLLLGRLRFQQRRCAEAEQLFRRHLAVRTNSLQGLAQLGLAQFCQDQWKDAAASFRAALAIKPDFAQAHNNLGLALSRAGDSEGALAAFRDALRCQPGDAGARAAIAEELLRLGRNAEALREAGEALQLDPRQPKALRVREAANAPKK